MEECLAIKPDLVFFWDEAWFAFARCGVTYRQRTGMATAASLREKYRSAAVSRGVCRVPARASMPTTTNAWLNTRLLPDPDKVRIRVYVTHSTHKTLTSLRQGSMIHVHDQDFQHKVSDTFHEAYMTHTSTSPNYQILASLDVGRRQVELEGFELVKKQLEMAMVLREKVLMHPTAEPLFPVPDRQGHDPGRIPQERHRGVLRAGQGLDRLLRGVADRRVRARSEPAHPGGRPDRRRRQHVQERLPDEQVRHPDQQDVAQHRPVHDQYRHDAQLGRLPDRRAGADRRRPRRPRRGFQPGRAGAAGPAGAQPDP